MIIITANYLRIYEVFYFNQNLDNTKKIENKHAKPIYSYLKYEW